MSDQTPQTGPASELTPDELEQRQRPDGTLVDETEGLDDIGPDVPVDADVIEQHQLVEADDEDDHPRQ